MIREERGQVTAFVVGMILALFVLAGLVIDGGYTLAARRRAFDEANAAARAGAQALNVDEFRATGIYVLDPVAAENSAQAYLSATGSKGVVQVAGDRVSVEVTASQRMALLRVLGISQLTMTGKGEARMVSGTGSANP